VCFYTYYEGLFRGIYLGKNYHSLNWGMEVDEVIELEMNFSKGTMLVGLRNNKECTEEVNIKFLLTENQNTYFFI
jgi:hypothetical protein